MLAEIQRIADEKINPQRAHQFPEVELLRLLAKWACELLLNSTPVPGRGQTVVVGERADEERTGPVDRTDQRRSTPGGRRKKLGHRKGNGATRSTSNERTREQRGDGLTADPPRGMHHPLTSEGRQSRYLAT